VDVTDQFHSPAAFSPGKEYPVPMRQEVKWASESLSTMRRSGQELLGKVKERKKILRDSTFGGEQEIISPVLKVPRLILLIEVMHMILIHFL
jgi:hypothetical protein